MRTLLIRVALMFALTGFNLAVAATLTIQPIQVCDDGGTSCANPSFTLFETEGDKIWAQAGIDLYFLPWTTINESAYTSIDNMAELVGVWSTLTHPEDYVVSMYFVNQINFCGVVSTAYGCAASPGNRVLIADAVFTANRIDTISHELGHSLGLPHKAGNPADYLMTAGGGRTIPTGLDQIFPDGPALSKLSPDEIAIALQSDLLVPEPATLLLTLGGVALVFFKRRVSYFA